MNLIKKGFTMIELLVVISIIGILASMALVSFTSSQKQARDTTRKSDIKQYQTLLESYANSNSGLYPSKLSATDMTNICATLGVTNTCPADPKSPDMIYKYISDGSGGVAIDATNYVLWSSLESQSGSYWIICSNGKAGIFDASPNSSICPI